MIALGIVFVFSTLMTALGAAMFLEKEALSLTIFSIVLVNALMFIGTYIVDKSQHAENRVQRFMVVTSVQLLFALFYVLFLRFVMGKLFFPMSMALMVTFILGLIIQSIYLIGGANKSKSASKRIG